MDIFLEVNIADAGAGHPYVLKKKPVGKKMYLRRGLSQEHRENKRVQHLSKKQWKTQELFRDIRSHRKKTSDALEIKLVMH